MDNEFNALTPTPPARRVFGSRRLTLESQAWRSAGDQFPGLPDGIASPHKLLAVVKAAAPVLRLSGTDQRMMDKLFQYTRPIDWTAASRPIVSVSNEVLCADLSLSRSAVQRALRRLQEHGLIVMKDSPTGQRYFRRDEKSGAIIPEKSFGIDLSLLSVRYADLAQMAERHDAEKKAHRSARRRAIIAWRMVAQCIETADEEGLWAAFWESLEPRASAMRTAIANVTTLAERTHVATTLESMAAEAREVLQGAFKSREQETQTRPAGAADATLNNDTEGSLDCYTVSAQQKVGSRLAKGSQRNGGDRAAEKTTAPADVRIAPDEIVRLVPEIKAMAGPAPTWADLGEACEKIRVDFEIGLRLWDRAHAVLGMQRRIIAFADMLTYNDNHFTKGRGAYFAGMIKLAEAGQLNLGSSLYGMRRRGSGDRPVATSKRRAAKHEAPRSFGSLAADLARRCDS